MRHYLLSVAFSILGLFCVGDVFAQDAGSLKQPGLSAGKFSQIEEQKNESKKKVAVTSLVRQVQIRGLENVVELFVRQ